VELTITTELFLRERTLRVDDERDAIDPEHEREQNLCVETGGRLPASLEIGGRPAKDAFDRPDLVGARGHEERNIYREIERSGDRN
jgi:hypothetical protein